MRVSVIGGSTITDEQRETARELGRTLALDYGRPVAGLDTHRIDGIDGIEHVETPGGAVDHVESAVGEP